MKYAWLVILAFCVRCFTVVFVLPPLDGDLWWQRWLGAKIVQTHAIPRTLGGETFTAPNAPWLPQEWLFGVAAYVGRSGIGWDVFASACALAAVAALTIACEHARRRGASSAAIATLALFCAIALIEAFGVRAQVVAWPVLALFLVLLDLDGPWCYAAIGVAALWSNLHASAVLAPVVAAACAAGSAFDEGAAGARTRRLATVAAACVLAICLNPFGWGLPLYAFGLFNSPIRPYFEEWHVTDLQNLSFAFGALPLVLFAMALGTRAGPSGAINPHRWRDLFLLGIFGFLMAYGSRNIGIFALVALPIVAPALTWRVPWFERRTEPPPSWRGRAATLGSIAAVLCLALLSSWNLAQRMPAALVKSPIGASAALDALAKMPGEHDLLCLDFTWCSLALGSPNVRVFIDGRADPFPLEVWSDYGSLLRLKDGWRSMLDRRHVDAILARCNGPADQALARTAAWRAAYAGSRYRLWIRSRSKG